MIYQTHEGFYVYSFKATYEDKEEYVSNKEQFERDILNRLSMLGEGEPVLPTITYSEVSLDAEQQSRFNYVKDLQGISLGEVVNYVISSIEPTCPSYEIKKLKEQNSLLELQNGALTDRTEFLEATIEEIILQVYSGI